MVELNYNP